MAKLELLTAAVLMMSSIALQQAHAAAFDVDDVGAAADQTPGDGLCQTAAATCTFSAALTEANAAPTADVIALPAGTWTTDVVYYDLEIAGVGTAVTIIDGGRGSSTLYTGAVFMTRPNVSFTVRGMTVQNGWSAVNANGPLTVVDSLLRDHNDTAIRCDPSGGSTAIINSVLNNNRGANAGGAISCYDGPLFVGGSSFSGNHSVNVGGAIACMGAHIVGSSFYRNRVGNAGGAVHADGALTLSGSTFKGNSAFNVGGGLAASAGVDVSNSTFVGNGAGNTGGGLHLDGSSRLNNVTIVGNSCGNVGAGISVGDDGSLHIANSILFNNSGSDCGDDNYHSDGYNFLEAECGGVATTGDQVAVAPLIGFLASLGGPTQTIPLLAGSPAIDAGGPGCEAMDQRGIPRPQGAGCDVGAYEALACDFDGTVDPGEQCDDGNQNDGDGCSALCEAELLAGRKLHLEGGASGSGKLQVQLSDARVGLGFGNFSFHDPVLHGGSIRVTSTTGDGIDVTVPLPADGWEYIGRPGGNRGYKYKRSGGTVQQVKILPGRQIKVKGSGVLDVGLGLDPNPVQVVITIGSRHFSGQYGGETRFARNRYFRAKKAPPPGAMP